MTPALCNIILLGFLDLIKIYSVGKDIPIWSLIPFRDILSGINWNLPGFLPHTPQLHLELSFKGRNPRTQEIPNQALCHSSQKPNKDLCSKYACNQLFATPWAIAHQVPLFMGFPRQEYWSGLPFPSPGHLPNPGIEPTSPLSSALADTFLHHCATCKAPWEAVSVKISVMKMR